MRRTLRIGLVLDSSGSMSSIRDATIEAFNNQIDVMDVARDKNEKVRVTLTMIGEMSHLVRIHYEDKDPAVVVPLNIDTYRPHGMTPLCDGMGLTIKALQAQEEDDDDFLVIAITDGFENASREYNRESIKNLVKEMEKKGNWTFAYIGSSDQWLEEATSLGINASSSLTFTNTTAGVESMAMSGVSCYQLYNQTRTVEGGMQRSTSNYFVPEQDQSQPVTKATAEEDIVTFSTTNEP